MRWLLDWWRARQRRIDMDILWPVCLEQAGEAVQGEDWHGHDPLALAKMAFCVHCMNDPAWKVLGEKAIVEFIDKLEAHD